MTRYFVCAVFLFCAALVLQASGEEANDNHLPYGHLNCDAIGCFFDLTPHCMLSGRTVFGSCEYRTAICHQGELYDRTGAACLGNDN